MVRMLCHVGDIKDTARGPFAIRSTDIAPGIIIQFRMKPRTRDVRGCSDGHEKTPKVVRDNAVVKGRQAMLTLCQDQST